MSIKLYEEEQNPKPWKIIAIFVIVLFLLAQVQCCNGKTVVAQDTVICHPENIVKIIEQPTKKSSRFYVIYKTSKWQDIIPISKSVVEYYSNCKSYNITPNLAFIVKDGVISRVIRYKTRFKIN